MELRSTPQPEATLAGRSRHPEFAGHLQPSRQIRWAASFLLPTGCVMTQAALEQVRADDSKLAGEHLPPTNSATPPNRKNHRLTKKEMAAVRGIQREVAENEGIVLGWCFINAQR